MRKLVTIALLAAAIATPAIAGQPLEGNTILKDSQPAGVANKHDKHHKHQVFDLTFDADGNEYICRTNSDKSMNPTDFIVGSGVHYELNGKKVRIRTQNDKKVDCQVVRVALIPAAPRY